MYFRCIVADQIIDLSYITHDEKYVVLWDVRKLWLVCDDTVYEV